MPNKWNDPGWYDRKEPFSMTQAVARVITGTVIVILLITLAVRWMVDNDNKTMVPKNQTTVIAEDSPQWDCHTMGNHECGDLGPRLQREAGDGYEVIFDPVTGVYHVEPLP